MFIATIITDWIKIFVVVLGSKLIGNVRDVFKYILLASEANFIFLRAKNIHEYSKSVLVLPEGLFYGSKEKIIQVNNKAWLSLKIIS